jgi:hypothetical protein
MISREMLDARLEKAHGDLVTLDHETYRGLDKYARFVDREFGEWEATPAAVFRGTRHPERARAASRISFQEASRRLERIAVIDETTYKNWTTPCAAVDAAGHTHRTTPANLATLRMTPKSTMRSQEKMERVVLEASDGYVSLAGPYRGMLDLARFRDWGHGEFTALPVNVIHKGTRHPAGSQDRRRAAFRARFGADHHMQNSEQFRKYLRSVHKHVTRIEHWSTGKELVCRGSYEVAVVHFLNRWRIPFQWQPAAFRLPSGSAYHPDLYLPDADLWVEIKGRWTPIGKEKWEWFSGVHKNSLLLERDDLRALGILPTPKKRRSHAPP